MKTTLALACASVILLRSAVGSATQGPVAFSTYDPLDNYTCGLSSARVTAFRSMLDDMMMNGRAISGSRAMRDCVERMMNTGGTLPHLGKLRAIFGSNTNWGTINFGPYDIHELPGASDAYMAGALNHFYQAGDTTSLRPLQALRAWNMAMTPWPLRVDCASSALNAFQAPSQYHINAGAYGYGPDGDRREEIRGAESQIATFADHATDAEARAFLLMLVYHEVLHLHGYVHGNDTGGDQNSPLRRSVNDIVGACAANIYLGGQSCAPCNDGYAPVLDSLDGATCTCRPGDPTLVDAPQLSAFWSGLPASSYALNDRGDGYAIQPGTSTVWCNQEGSWHFLGWPTGQTVTAVFGGGLGVFVRTASGRLYRNPYPSAASAWSLVVGNARTLAAADQVALDGFGTIYFTQSVCAGCSNTHMDIYRIPAGSTDTTARKIGNGAQWIGAGGDRLLASIDYNPGVLQFDVKSYVQGSSNVWWEITSFNAWSRLAVDSYGVLYGLDPTSSYLYRYNAFPCNSQTACPTADWSYLGVTGRYGLAAGNALWTHLADGSWSRWRDDGNGGGSWSSSAYASGIAARGGRLLYTAY